MRDLNSVCMGATKLSWWHRECRTTKELRWLRPVRGSLTPTTQKPETPHTLFLLLRPICQLAVLRLLRSAAVQDWCRDSLVGSVRISQAPRAGYFAKDSYLIGVNNSQMRQRPRNRRPSCVKSLASNKVEFKHWLTFIRNDFEEITKPSRVSFCTYKWAYQYFLRSSVKGKLCGCVCKWLVGLSESLNGLGSRSWHPTHLPTGGEISVDFPLSLYVCKVEIKSSKQLSKTGYSKDIRVTTL